MLLSHPFCFFEQNTNLSLSSDWIFDTMEGYIYLLLVFGAVVLGINYFFKNWLIRQDHRESPIYMSIPTTMKFIVRGLNLLQRMPPVTNQMIGSVKFSCSRSSHYFLLWLRVPISHNSLAAEKMESWNVLFFPHWKSLV